MVGFGAFWGVFFKVELFVLHAKNSVLRLTKLAIAPFSRYSLSNSTVTLTSRSPEMTWFDRAHKTFYWSLMFLATMSLSCLVSEIQRDIGRKSLNFHTPPVFNASAGGVPFGRLYWFFTWRCPGPYPIIWEKTSAEFKPVSRVHQRYRQTDRQTDRQFRDSKDRPYA